MDNSVGSVYKLLNISLKFQKITEIMQVFHRKMEFDLLIAGNVIWRINLLTLYDDHI